MLAKVTFILPNLGEAPSLLQDMQDKSFQDLEALETLTMLSEIVVVTPPLANLIVVRVEVQIDSFFMQGIHNLSCSLDRAFSRTAHSEIDPNTLAIVEDATKIVDTCVPIIGSKNIETVSSSIIQEQQESVASLRHDDEETPKE